MLIVIHCCCSVVSDSMWPQGLQHIRLSYPTPSPGVCSNSCPLSRWCHPTNPVVPHRGHEPSCASDGTWTHSELCNSLCMCEVAQSCPTLCDPVDCSLPGSSLHGILQARILEWVAMSFSRASSQPRGRTWVSRIVGRRFYLWVTSIDYMTHPSVRWQVWLRLTIKGQKWTVAWFLEISSPYPK